MTSANGSTADPPNLPLLIKLLKLTTASNDAEALSAIRRANEQLAKFGGDWERLLRGKVTIIADPFASPSIPVPPAQTHSPPTTPPPPAPRRPPARPSPSGPPTFTRLLDKTWGISSPTILTRGQVVTIHRANGTTSIEQVGSYIGQNHSGYHVYKLKQTENLTRSQRSAVRSAPIDSLA